MKTFYDTLKQLVDWGSEPGTLVLSLYLDIGPGHERRALSYAEGACDELLGHLDADSEEERAFDEMVRGLLDTLAAEIELARAADYDGLCVFACAEPALHEVVRLRFPFTNQADAGRAPHLRQLLYYQEEYEQSVGVTVTPGDIHVCEIHVGDARGALKIRPTHGRTREQETAATLHRLLHGQPHLHVILMGEPAARAALEAAFDQPIVDRVIARLDEALLPSDNGYLRGIHRALQAYERQAEAAGVAALLARQRAGLPAAVGLHETLEAINRGKVSTLYLLQSFSTRGWLCDVCGRMGILPAPPACTACGASVSVVPLEEHMLDQAAACGAEIDTVFESEELSGLGGVAALLHVEATPAPPRAG
jgi:hypothetical protein